MNMIKEYSITIFLCVVLTITYGSAQNDIRVHDPVLIKQDSIFHIFCTGKGIGHFTSNDLKNWKEEPPVFAEKPSWTSSVVPDFGNHIWAPDVLHYKDVYYLFYSVSAFAKNTSGIGVVTNHTLDPKSKLFKWVDHGLVIQSIPNRDLWNAIDPNISFDEKGTPWMTFGSFWEGMKLVKLDKSLTKIAEPQEWHTIARRQRSFELSDKNPGDAAIEAPFIFKKNGWYYLFVSWDYCCRGKESNYKVVMGRSKNIEGPYFDQEGVNLFHGGGTLVVQGNEQWNGAGHCSVYTIDEKDYMIFHAYDATDDGKPKLKIAEIRWNSDQWPIPIRKY